MRLQSFFAVLLFPFLFMCSCTATKMKSYANPAFTKESYASFALLPIRNVSLTPSEAIEVNRFFYKEMKTRNPEKKVIDPLESTKLINDANLVPVYDTFLREFENTGIPNTNSLKLLGAQLHCDAFIQGVIENFRQQDASGTPGFAAKTSVTLRYVIISAKTGDILWETSCAATKTGATIFSQAPPLFDVLLKAQKQIVASIPKV